jgi:TonB family protein
METGTVGLLIYVARDGSVESIRIQHSSGSDALDQAAANCVQEYGQFAVKRIGARPIGYWGRMKFNWSIGN